MAALQQQDGPWSLYYRDVRPWTPGLTRRRCGRCVALALVGALLLAGCEDWFPRGDEPERETPAKPEPDPEPEPDTAPIFAGTIADQSYTAGEAITPLTLPAANGGNGTLSYSLTPTVPGLAFAAATRTLSGTPTTAGTYNLTYQAIDGDTNTAARDAATLTFTITVQEPPEPACPAHAATRIVGDWIDDGGLAFPSGWVFSFRADGTFQINYGAVKINNESEGNYSYDATTCTLAWRGTEPAAEPSIGIVAIGGIETVTIRGANEHFVDWNGPDRFCTRFTADSLFCISTFTRRTGS